ncbi:MAG: GTPase ObgE [Armatimonadetes bacterium]|nr:GTPase ObgE [Armatimonadota bacterium]
MTFIDEARIYVKGGDGGSGASSFRHEKFVPKGGPDGGDGGKGGSVVLVADEGLNTLIDFRYRRHFKARKGDRGEGGNRTGRSAEDLTLKVPRGTMVWDVETGDFVGDLSDHEATLLVAGGGRGGRGNARFASSRRQAPTVYEKGEPGEERWIRLELKLLADVGLVGLPNAGKSSFLARVSRARPKIADYPFTTLIPCLGMVKFHEQSAVFADIPGLIEGAHQGIGLGDRFLRHIERTRLILHIVDLSTLDPKQPLAPVEAIHRELASFSEELGNRPQILVGNKMDLPESREIHPVFARAAKKKKLPLFSISAATGEGMDVLIAEVFRLLPDLPKPDFHIFPVLRPLSDREFRIVSSEEGFVVSGKQVEKMVAMTDLDNDEACVRLQMRLERLGLEQALQDAGVKPGDRVAIGEWEFEYGAGTLLP